VGTPVAGQSSDQIHQLMDTLASSRVTGWDVAVAIVILVVSYPVGHLARKLTTKAVRRVSNLPDFGGFGAVDGRAYPTECLVARGRD